MSDSCCVEGDHSASFHQQETTSTTTITISTATTITYNNNWNIDGMYCMYECWLYIVEIFLLLPFMEVKTLEHTEKVIFWPFLDLPSIVKSW